MAKRRAPKAVETLTHAEASRKNIPTAEYQAVMEDDDRSPVQVAYERRNRDLDPQLVWRGKVRQRTLLNLGRHFGIGREGWPRLWAMEQVGLMPLLEALGVNGALRAAAAGLIVGRLAHPASERETHRWLDRSASPSDHMALPTIRR